MMSREAVGHSAATGLGSSNSRHRADIFTRFSAWTTRVAGGRWAFVIALATVVIWAATGPIFHYSDYWQLVINTGTTIVTFLMVFLIQSTQKWRIARDSSQPRRADSGRPQCTQ
jgi:hypothetical protein